MKRVIARGLPHVMQDGMNGAVKGNRVSRISTSQNRIFHRGRQPLSGPNEKVASFPLQRDLVCSYIGERAPDDGALRAPEEELVEAGVLDAGCGVEALG